jgi:hypothetical protein
MSRGESGTFLLVKGHLLTICAKNFAPILVMCFGEKNPNLDFTYIISYKLLLSRLLQQPAQSNLSQWHSFERIKWGSSYKSLYNSQGYDYDDMDILG